MPPPCDHVFPQTSVGKDDCPYCGLSYDQWISQFVVLAPDPYRSEED